MGQSIRGNDSEESSVNAKLDRLAELLREQPPERVERFHDEVLFPMAKKRSSMLATAIKAQIKARKLTAYALGKASGVDAVVIQRFLNGERSITLGTAERLCHELDLVLVPRSESTGTKT